MKILLTGASGKLGKEVLAIIPEAVPLVRRECGLKNEIITDFSKKELEKILQNADVIIHLAGSMNFDNRNELRETNIGLTWNIVNCSPERTKIIFASSISVYGKKPVPLPIIESTPVAPDSEYSRSKEEAEEIVKRKKNHVILRIGTVYGPQFPDYQKMLKLLAKGRLFLVGTGNNHLPFVHVKDVALAIVSSVAKGAGIYVLTGECKTQKEIYGIAAEQLGVKPPVFQMPVALARVFLQFFGGKTFTSEHIAVLSSDRIFDCSKAKKELGFTPCPIEDGIKEIAATIRSKT